MVGGAVDFDGAPPSPSPVSAVAPSPTAPVIIRTIHEYFYGGMAGVFTLRAMG